MTIKKYFNALIPAFLLTTSSISCDPPSKNSIDSSKKELASDLMTEFVSKFVLNSKDVCLCENEEFSIERPKNLNRQFSSKFINTFFDIKYNTAYFIEQNRNSVVYYHMSMDKELHNSLTEFLDELDKKYENITLDELVKLFLNYSKEYESFKNIFINCDNKQKWVYISQRKNLINIKQLNKAIDIDVLWNKELNKIILLGKSIYLLDNNTNV